VRACLVVECTDGVVPRLVVVVRRPVCSSRQRQLVVEQHSDAVVDRQERRHAVAAARRRPEPDATSYARRLEPGAGHRHVEPELVERVRATTTHVAAELTSEAAEDRLQRVRVRVSCTTVVKT